MSAPVRIAMWSGPRNVSTALLRSFGSRPDTHVSDEPLYGHYLATTRVRHPGREELVAVLETDWRRVVAEITGPVPGGKPVWYQKHMAHHLLPGMERAWLGELRSALLVRDPREVLLSLGRVMPEPDLADTGLPQQVELFEAELARTGAAPPVVDGRDLLADPEGVLRALCAAVGIEFLPAMLRWEPGPRPTDGPWARWWYERVERSTGFEPWAPRDEALPERLRAVHARCVPLYERLRAHRIGPAAPE